MRPEPTSRPLLIEGLGRKMPAHVVDNAKLSELAGKSYLGIEDRCGVLTRHFADRAAGETAPVLGAQAAQAAMADAGCTLDDIDLIISASGTSHQFIPDQAVFIQRALGAGRSGIPCFSVHTSCLSFVTALDIAASHLASGRYRRILIVTAEIASAGLNLQDAESGPLFGDAAVAAVVRRTQPDDPVSPNAAIHRVRFESYGDDADLTGVPGSGTHLPANDPNTPLDASYFRMSGLSLLKRALRYIPPFVEKLYPEALHGTDDDPVFILHQASRAGLNLVGSLKLPEESIVRTLSEYGNCVAASIPLTLLKAVETGKLRRGQTAVMMGTAAGVTYGGVVLTY
ncbi:MAG: ketoacyl-ACP synthase III [Deltaproteobacteria bacterium]|nr:ketoacyl-ACP synthase III [Deltaproteobacteria bacterium]